MNYYQRHLGDYARDTAHLSLLEHGVYTLLLDRYYATEQPIPADQAYRVARAKSKDEREAVDSVLAEFFTAENGLWINKRAQAEIERAQAKIEAARANGQTGGRPKKNPTVTQQKPSGLPIGSKAGTQEKALQSPISNLHTPCSEATLPRVQSARDDADWAGHREWVLDELRSIYPSNLHTDCDWEAVARVLAGRLTAGETTREDLHLLTLQFAAQQDAKGNRNTQFIENPSKHYDGRGKWKGPFNLPPKPESANDRIERKLAERERNGSAIDGEVIHVARLA
jgi:uncharacterized protein YdaU (DUF1376 family)